MFPAQPRAHGRARRRQKGPLELGSPGKLSTAAAMCHGMVLYAAGTEAALPAHGTGKQAVEVPR